MSDSGSSERRAFYRLRYPREEYPVLLFDARTFPVVEISEFGMRVLHQGERLVPDRAFSGWVRFRDGESVPVEGTVYRTDRDETILKLTVCVSLKRMLDEQRRIIHLYPGHLEPPDRPE